MKRENLDARLLSLTPVSLDFSRCTAHTGHATSQLAFTTSGFGKFLAFATKNQEISKTQVILVLLRISTNLLYGCATRITEPPPEQSSSPQSQSQGSPQCPASDLTQQSSIGAWGLQLTEVAPRRSAPPQLAALQFCPCRKTTGLTALCVAKQV